MVSGGLDLSHAETVFTNHTLDKESLEKLDEARVARGEEPKYVDGPPVVDAAELRVLFLEMGDEVESKQLFELVQMADEDGEGTVCWERFKLTVKTRSEWLDRQRKQKLLSEAYVALGGSQDREQSISSAALLAITTDFLGPEATAAGLEGAVASKQKAIQVVLDMGGQLDEEDEAEMKNTELLSFEDLESYASALATRVN
eukprot:CAMPEP_0119319680 /NCGR_PEP_ID=MMETSP1333-20130426/50053_1 /TAXON_ID=418940 /ORGANISM="Scyphosphaera apsteinii, Strain RCC1455" /LENGTH=200 /DNA_ID=CAMNT_0007326151 /DNA_START=77 /DNA_END=679 /DNA_ORIENTATION=+